MKIKNSISLPLPIVEYATDDFLRLIGASDTKVQIITINPDSLDVVSKFDFQTIPHNFYQPCLDDDCIYLPTKVGQILVIDKFSGELILVMNSKFAHIMSDIHQNDKFIFCIGGIPINTKHRLNLDNFCMLVFDKESGKKIVQTEYFGGQSFLEVRKDIAYAIAGQQLLKFSVEGELIKKVQLSSDSLFRPILSESHIICCHMAGLVEVFDSKLNRQGMFSTLPPIAPPVMGPEDEILWFSQDGVCRVDFHKQVFRYIKTNNTMHSPLVEKDKGYLFGCDKSGSLSMFNLSNERTEIIKLSNEQLRQSAIVGNNLFVVSLDKLHHIEVN